MAEFRARDKVAISSTSARTGPGKKTARRLCLSLLVAVPAAGLAEPDSSEPPVRRLEPVVVEAPRVPVEVTETTSAVSVVDGPEQQPGSEGLALDETLERAPGVFVQNRYNFAQDIRLSIRGYGARSPFGIRGIRLFLDGIPLTLPDGQSQVDPITLQAVTRAEIMRGPQAALYGNASGGVVHLETKEGQEDPAGQLEGLAGEHGQRRVSASVGGPLGKWRQQWTGTGLWLDGHREQSRVRKRNLYGKAMRPLDDGGSLTGVVSLLDAPVTDDPGALSRAQADADPHQAADGNLLYNAGQDVNQGQVGTVYRGFVGETTGVTARAYYARRDFENRLPFEPGGIVTFVRDFYGVGAELEREDTVFDRPVHWVSGIELEHQQDDRQNYDNEEGTRGDKALDQIEDVRTGGVYARGDLEWNADWRLSLGLRADRLRFAVNDRFNDGIDDASGSETFDELSIMAGVSRALAPDHRAYATVANAYQTPTTTEFANPDGSGFNPDLGPERSVNLEVGAKGEAGERWRYDVAAFAINLRDELIPYEENGRDFFENAGKSRRLGLEAGVALALTRHVTLSANYTYSRFYFREFVDDDGVGHDGNRIPGIPRHVFFGELGWENDHLFGAVEARGVSRRHVDNANSEAAPAYGLVNLRAGRRWRDGAFTWEPFVGIHNLFDEDYDANVRINAADGSSYYEPGPGRYYYAGLRIRME